jgi:hypothetical protein
MEFKVMREKQFGKCLRFSEKILKVDAFIQWQRVVVDQNFSVRMQAFCMQVALKQL